MTRLEKLTSVACLLCSFGQRGLSSACSTCGNPGLLLGCNCSSGWWHSSRADGSVMCFLLVSRAVLEDALACCLSTAGCRDAARLGAVLSCRRRGCKPTLRVSEVLLQLGSCNAPLASGWPHQAISCSQELAVWHGCMSSQPSNQMLDLVFPQACGKNVCDSLEHQEYGPPLFAVLRFIDA